MFTGIENERFTNLTEQERRWFDNIKKAFSHSDEAMQNGHAADKCLAELFTAVDTAKTLRRSLLGETYSHHQNRLRFIEFLGLEIPACRPESHKFQLNDRRSGSSREYTLGEIIYDVRCMIHENENLNLAEDIDYHILLDWSHPNPQFPITIQDGTLIANGFFIWNRLREVMSKFITVLDAYHAMAANVGSFSISINPDLGSIRPERKQRPR
jgi:hypothetical protein